jgi:hypothetical protein
MPEGHIHPETPTFDPQPGVTVVVTSSSSMSVFRKDLPSGTWKITPPEEGGIWKVVPSSESG